MPADTPHEHDSAPRRGGSRQVVRVPDIRLRAPSEAVVGSGWDEAELAEILESELAANELAVGIAAVQIGICVRAFAMWANRFGSCGEGDSDHGLVVVFDPVAERSGELEGEAEGCLSVPGRRAWVERHHHVVLRGRDTSGQAVRLELTGWEARVCQHELDHLDGVLITEAGRVFEG